MANRVGYLNGKPGADPGFSFGGGGGGATDFVRPGTSRA